MNAIFEQKLFSFSHVVVKIYPHSFAWQTDTTQNTDPSPTHAHTHMNGQSKYKFFPSGFLTALSANVQSQSLFVRPQCRSLELSPYIHNSNDIMPFFLRSSLCSLPCSWLKSNTKSQTSPVQMTDVKIETDTNFLRIPSKLFSHLCRFYEFSFQFSGNLMC